MRQAAGSFRDPSGTVYEDPSGKIIRTIDVSYRPHWEKAIESGLLSGLLDEGLLIPFKEVSPVRQAWKTLEAEKIPYISSPSEWSFTQFRDAALLTLRIQKKALLAGMTLKDASAYNVQFLNARPIFIDLLSFETRSDNEPWQAYRQFCMHFLAPLALLSQDVRLGRLSSLWIDGIPLDLAWRLLGWKKYISAGLQMHLKLHYLSEQKYSDARTAARKIKKTHLSTRQLTDLTDSLLRTVQSLKRPVKSGEWTDYYSDTNYTSAAEEAKETFVRHCAEKARGELALDLGANTGRYSAVLRPFFTQVIASDIDAQAVDLHYQALQGKTAINVLPQVLDLGNPTPGIGWACEERLSWMRRSKVDFVCALALTHHLFFTTRIPWREQASFFADLLRPEGRLLVEFVPKEDSQVRRLLAARDDIFADYSLACFKEALAPFFLAQEEHLADGSSRILLFLQKK